jgi:hypothetical protein
MSHFESALVVAVLWIAFTTFDMYMKGHGWRALVYSFGAFLIIIAIAFTAAVVLLLFVDVNSLLAGVKFALSSPYALFLGVIVAVALYRIRGTHPVLYGTAEIAVGVLSIWFVVGVAKFTPITADDSSQTRETSAAISSLVGFLGGMYIIIRGFDNIEKGIGGRVRRIWNLAFPRRARG